ncbi:hypothetical protein G5B30_16545 [Sphingobacterium sp. SGG-5]|uniref:hypothetical protein n=1 Tax=Sphingobacterium sp. SGG-5 TaxID=2710881 RepID=UPI0013EDC85C|nr:hypothetical protein [Sphingobacterium sp. SGG-5]NGM63520.1 hypothetical protein [Sphingobacterium sp. SGG-5]
MSVEVIINEVTTDEYVIELITEDPDLLPLVERAETAADSAEDARDTAVQSAADALLSEQAAALSEGNAQGYANTANQAASDAADALLQIGGFYDLEDAPGFDENSTGQSLTNVGRVLIWQ